jgi:hypothetical protein
LNTAYAVKLDKAFLDELSSSLEYLKKNPAINSELISNITIDVAKPKNEVIPSHSEVKLLGETIDKLFGPKIVIKKNKSNTSKSFVFLVIFLNVISFKFCRNEFQEI